MLTVGGCFSASAHDSHLSADDQQFCSSLSDDPIKTLRADLDDLIKDNHFATQGDAFAFETVDLQQSWNALEDANIQDRGLAAARDAAVTAMGDVDVDPSRPTVDSAPLRELAARLNAMQRYCDTN